MRYKSMEETQRTHRSETCKSLSKTIFSVKQPGRKAKLHFNLRAV